MIFAEGIFEGESMVAHPARAQGELEIPLKLPKNAPIDVHVKTCIGTKGSEILMVLELTHQLPAFCMYEAIAKPQNSPVELKDCGAVMEVRV